MKIQKMFFFAILLFVFTACSNKSDDPQIDNRDKFIGTWDVSETWTPKGGSGTAFNYEIEISKKTDASKIKIKNFADLTLGGIPIDAEGTMTTSTAFTIEESNRSIDNGLGGSDVIDIKGNGSISGAVITITYSLYELGKTEPYGSAVMTVTK